MKLAQMFKFPEIERPAEVVRFEPQPDITAWELAIILKRTNVVLGWEIEVKDEKPIPPELRRHFRAVR
jgi:hypothetical protein